MNFPEELKYTVNHEWVKVEKETVLIGLTDFAQAELGDIVYVEIIFKEKEIRQEEVFGSVEAVKTVSDLYMPVSGVVLEANEKLDKYPDLLNKDPYGEGWIARVVMLNPSEVDSLLSAVEYQQYIGQSGVDASS